MSTTAKSVFNFLDRLYLLVKDNHTPSNEISIVECDDGVIVNYLNGLKIRMSKGRYYTNNKKSGVIHPSFPSALERLIKETGETKYLNLRRQSTGVVWSTK